MLGDWAPGSSFRPLRAVTEFNPDTGIPTASNFEGEVYSPNGNLLMGIRFRWEPADPGLAQTVMQLGQRGLADVMKQEGLQLYVPPAPPPPPAP